MLVVAGSGCDQRSAPLSKAEEKALGRRAATKRANSPREAPSPQRRIDNAAEDHGSGVPPLVPFPRDLSAETKKLAARLDAQLRYPGSTIWRVITFLRYPSRCKTAATRFQTLVAKRSKGLAAHRNSLAGLRTELGGVAAADKKSLWRWFGALRVHLEDEVRAHSEALSKAADRFVRGCPKQTAQLIELSRPLADTRFRLLGELHDLAMIEGGNSLDRLPARPDIGSGHLSGKAAPHSVRPPKGVTAASRARCLRISRCFDETLWAMRQAGAFLRAGDCKAVRHRYQQDQPHWDKWNRATSRACMRRFVLLTRVESTDLARVKRWFMKVSETLGKKMREPMLRLASEMQRFVRHCPRDAKLLQNMSHRQGASQNLTLQGIAYALEQAAQRRRDMVTPAKIRYWSHAYWPEQR